MISVVYKWTLWPGEGTLLVPPGAKVLSAKPQSPDIVLYTASRDTVANETIRTLVIPTGMPWQVDLDAWEFVDTVDLDGLFFHVFVGRRDGEYLASTAVV